MSNQFHKTFAVLFPVFAFITKSFAPMNDLTFFSNSNHIINNNLISINDINRNTYRHVKTSLWRNSVHCRCWYFFPHFTKLVVSCLLSPLGAIVLSTTARKEWRLRYVHALFVAQMLTRGRLLSNKENRAWMHFLQIIHEGKFVEISYCPF